MNLKLEAIVVPVSDVDRAKKFYEEQLGFRVDVDHRSATYENALGFRHRGEATYRIVQLTPPGSECSIQFGIGLTRATSGSYEGLYLITKEIEATRAELLKRGVEVSEPFDFGPQGQTSGPHPERADYSSFASFTDPDGNGWLIQEVKKRALGR